MAEFTFYHCTNCQKGYKFHKGYIFTLEHNGVRWNFCNIECCDAWEKKHKERGGCEACTDTNHNHNDRRGAVLATREKHEINTRA